MTEQEAITIANGFMEDSHIENAGIKLAFFIPGQPADPSMPKLNDRWVIHYKYPMRDDQFDQMLVEHIDQSDVIIVVVDLETRLASVRATL